MRYARANFVLAVLFFVGAPAAAEVSAAPPDRESDEGFYGGAGIGGANGVDLDESTLSEPVDVVAEMVEDGSTFQLGLGATPQAILLALADKNDLGVHTQFIIDGIMDLVPVGVITNRFKGINDGKLVASNAVGSDTFSATVEVEEPSGPAYDLFFPTIVLAGATAGGPPAADRPR